MRKTAIHCQNIVKHYGHGESKVMALNKATISIKQGSLFMMVGPSGSGKTSLISVMSGILQFDSGRCQVLGHSFESMSPNEIVTFRRQYVGFVFQSYNLLPNLTAAENASVPLLINGVSRFEAMKKAEEMMEQVGLSHRINSYPRELSGGQQQRIAIARALIHSPEIIVCDEPTSALDHKTGKHVMEILKRMSQDYKRTMVIVTHDSRIFDYADWIAVMDDGMIIKEGRKWSDLGQE